MSKQPTKDAFKAKALFIDTKPTSYNTRFRKAALYQVNDMINNNGLPLLLTHNSDNLPVGSWYESYVDEEVEAVFTKFFVPKEIREYEDIKARIETGILDSVSIGFNAGVHDCSICGNDIQNYSDCPHIPGQKYEVNDRVTGASLGEEICYVMLDEVKASEGSLVHTGAVPRAKIVETSSKEDYFVTNNLNFSVGNLEVVHEGKILQDNDVNQEFEGENMEELAQLKIKYQDLNDKYFGLRETNVKLQEDSYAVKAKVDGFDKAIADRDEAIAAKDLAFSEKDGLIVKLGEKVKALAAVFEPSYNAPTDIEAIYTDLDKYLELSKALPSGQQTSTGEELSYSLPDDSYKV